MALDQDILRYLPSMKAAYLALHLAGGYIGLPILVATFLLSKRVHRPATVINLCITWIIYSVSYTLLFYGGYNNTADPAYELCFVQVAMIHGSPPMAVVAVFCVVVQIYTAYQLPWQNWHPKWVYRLPGWIVTTAIILPPYIVFIAFATASALLGLRHPDAIIAAEHPRIHCTFKKEIGAFEQYAVPGFCTVFICAIIILEVISIVKYYRGWLTIKHVFPLATQRPSLSPLFRIALFSSYSLAALGTCVSYLWQHLDPVLYMIQAALPLVATIVFATQTDVMSAWTFWRREQVAQVIQNPDYVPGGGWSRPTSEEISPQLTGHTFLSSEA